MINLLPDEYKEQMYYGRKNTKILSWLMTVVFGIAVLLIVAGVGRLTIQTARNQAVEQKKAVETQISDAKLDAVEKDYTTFVNGVGNVKKIYQQQILYSRLIRKLATLLPPGARLSAISLSDKDRAINLNFDNDADDLGPTIQLNLENQGDRIAEQSRKLTQENFGIALGGKLDSSGRAITAVDSDNKTIEFLISATDDPKRTDDDYDRYLEALKNGGEYAFGLVKEPLKRSNFLEWYELDQKQKRSPTSVPQMVSYKVDQASKSVDFAIRAETLGIAKQFEQAISSSPNSLFIETYIFEDTDYTIKGKCKDKDTSETTCEAVCKAGERDCSNSEKSCKQLTANGCQFIVRAYYDELFSSAKIDKIDEAFRDEECSPKKSSMQRDCTHRVTATYEPLFSKVDINRITSCATDQTTGQKSCPVEMRAEFGANAKFYLVNISAGGSQ